MTNEDDSEHNQTTASAISLGQTQPVPSALIRSMIAPNAGLNAIPACTIAVSVYAGQMALIRMPRLA